jgi:hypothetical protein
MLFWRKIFEDGHCPSPGLFAAPYLEFLELSLISYVKPSIVDPDPDPKLFAGSGSVTGLKSY